MKKVIIFVTMLFVCMVLFGCGKSDRNRILDKAEKMPYFECHDNYLDVVREENQTANAVWRVSCPEELKAVIDEYLPYPKAANIVGSGGRHIWRYEGIKDFSGVITIDLVTHSGDMYPGQSVVLRIDKGQLVYTGINEDTREK